MKFNFSHRFTGTIWRMIAAAERNLLFLEIRHGNIFQVEFSALNYQTNQFIWKDWRMKESWWVGLTAANHNTLLLHTFVNSGNPDHKNLIACDIFSQVVRWEVEDFSFHDWNDSIINGYRTKGDITPAQISIESGEVTGVAWGQALAEPDKSLLRPVQYLEGTHHFETIQRFMLKQINKPISRGVEYIEFGNWIAVSVYIQETEGLANYLIVMTKEGEIVLNEKLGKMLEGLGVDTFFILSGCLFFVKNRLELVAYTFYD